MDLVEICCPAGYSSKIVGKLGVILKAFKTSTGLKYGVAIREMTNARSDEGVYWFLAESLKFVKHLTGKELDYFLNNESKEENMEPSLRDTSGSMSSQNNSSMRNDNPGTIAIVRMYFDRKEKEVLNKRNDQVKALIDADANISAIRNNIKLAAEAALDKEVAMHYAESKDLFIFRTLITEEQIKIATDEYSKEIDNLGVKRNEVTVMLSSCRSYEDEINILIGYDIVRRTENHGIAMNA